MYIEYRWKFTKCTIMSQLRLYAFTFHQNIFVLKNVLHTYSNRILIIYDAVYFLIMHNAT